jgi:uncharacterized RDD family membrane protein YckC
MDDQLLDQSLMNDFADPNALETASLGKRFGTFVIDYIIIQILVTLLSIVYVGMYYDNLDALSEDSITTKSMDYLLGLIGFIGYYWLFEGMVGGRTIGKMIFSTRAVTTDGNVISGQTALKRALIRLVPLDPISFFGSYSSGWHDRWVDTMVVTEDSYQRAFR